MKQLLQLVVNKNIKGCMVANQVYHPAWIEIDIKQFKTNISIIRRHIGKCLLCLPIKANAYGHGLCGIGKAAEEAGVDYLAVAHLKEGVALREAGISIPILVLGAIHQDQIEDLLAFNLEFTISSQFKAELVYEKCKSLKHPCRVHLEVDTGMQRTGVRSKTALSLLEYLLARSCFQVVGVYSHFATADRPEDLFACEQIDRFNQLVSEPLFQKIPVLRHLANSGGVAYFPSSYFDMVRPACMAFGFLSNNLPENLAQITPCFSLKARVSYFKVVDEGVGISYGHHYKTKTRTRIVTVPVGYGDGYRRILSNRAEVLIRGLRFPIVGMICMDQFMVDVGDKEVYVGDEVVLIGQQGDQTISINDIASLYDTTFYEVLCGFNDRLPRIYVY
ncbi:MAG: alanine racemase [Chlamydiota bacterium]